MWPRPADISPQKPASAAPAFGFHWRYWNLSAFVAQGKQDMAQNAVASTSGMDTTRVTGLIRAGCCSGINGVSIWERRNSYPITAASFFAYQTKIFDILRTLSMFFYKHVHADGID